MRADPTQRRVAASSVDTSFVTWLADRVSSVGRGARVALARSPRLRWLAAAAAAGLAAWSYLAVVGEAAEARDSWGDTVDVWVAGRAIGPGEPFVVEHRRHPVAVVPPGALSAPPSADIVARRAVGQGEVVVEADLAGPPGLAALAPTGSVVVAVADPLLPSAAPGTRVIVASEGVLLASDAVVTASADGVVHIAVAAAAAPMVAAAAQQHLASVLIPAAPGPDQD